ncbi:alpha/beta hydrolase [Fervidibacillus halotolerans]|uniref:Alpha/beta hydrolase-fold protein n=1 Tax=Fervidibacillus halotolerans TaxID=2980027 RepID=A0A9E8M0H1_9BACI|nr:alpha/beta hydrolase-fold protein [Fervidibacillus halotolerans]WAA13092.1 alpha/beta hydrolase-fold protein [Fervidibacillus halotolerans]
MEKGRMQDITFFSDELNEDVELLVYLPPNYSEFHPYPYVVAQDGKHYFQLGRIARTLDELIQKNEMEPILFIGVSHHGVEDRRKKYHPNGIKKDAYIRFLAHELIPVVENHFSLSNTGTNRALAGDSLAGSISFLTAMKYPNTFGKLMLHSPYVNEEMIQIAKNFDQWHLLQMYHVIGSEEKEASLIDGSTDDFLTPNQNLQAVIRQTEAEYFFDIFSGNHSWKYWQQDLKRGLKYLFEKK